MTRKSDLLLSGAAGLVVALPLAIWLRDFTVDDALIPIRYAQNLHRGLGYRFNAGGASTDGVTPLGWPYALAPFAAGSAVDALLWASRIGLFAWCGGAWALGAAIGNMSGSRFRWAALSLIALSAPLAAWSASGLETAIVTALATVAVALAPTPRWAVTGALAAGLAAWLRPEMLAFATVIGVARGRVGPPAKKRITVALAIGPFIATALIRTLVWGRPVPLAVLAKPSDLQHGLFYVAACVLLTGAPLSAAIGCACRWRMIDPFTRTVVFACGAHAFSVVVVGGDWMPLSRLMVPILPALVLVTARALAFGPSPVVVFGLALGLAGEVFTTIREGPVASRVGATRRALIVAAAPAVAPLHHIAALDIGWLSAATPADILDLAGLTDLEVASLPGGHTSKAVSLSYLLGRGVDGIVMLLANTDPGDADPGKGESSPTTVETLDVKRGVERRLAAELGGGPFRVAWQGPSDGPNRYVLLVR